MKVKNYVPFSTHLIYGYCLVHTFLQVWISVEKFTKIHENSKAKNKTLKNVGFIGSAIVHRNSRKFHWIKITMKNK